MVVLAEPSHPGEVLKELYLDPLGMSAGTLAMQLKVPRTRVERLVKGETAVTADTALRLGHWFGTSPEFWLNLQAMYELRSAQAAMGAVLETLPRRVVPAAE